MSLVIVGSVALDNVQTPSGTAKDALGGAAVYSSVVSSLYTKTKLVGVVGEDFPQEHIDLLQKKNIDLKGLQTREGKTFRWSGVYENLNQAKTLDTQLNVFADFNPELPKSYLDSDYLFLGNIHPALQLAVLGQMNPKISACDTMNLWIDTERETLQKVIEKVDILFINDDEIKQFTDDTNVYRAAEKVLELGTKLVVVKRGEFGALAISKDLLFFVPAFPIKNVVDPTGAGDSFAGGFMGCLAKNDNFDTNLIKKSMLNGTICASYNIEDFSLNKTKGLKKENIEIRIEQMLKFMEVY